MRYELVVSAFAALAAAGLVDKRQTTAPGLSNVLKDISLATSDLGKLRGDIDAPGCNSCAYTGTQLVDILNDNQAVLYDIGNGTEAVHASNTFNSADSQKLASAVTASLYPSVTALLNDVQAHYPAFSSQGFQGIVSNILVTQKASATNFAGAFKTKVSGPATTVVPAVSASIVSVFDKAISVYAQ